MMTNQTFLAFYTLVMFVSFNGKVVSFFGHKNFKYTLHISTQDLKIVGKFSLNVQYEVYIAAYTL